MVHEPESNQQTHSRQDGEDSKPILLPPPQGKQEPDTKHDTRDLGRDDVEAAEDEEGANYGAAEVAGGQGYGGPAAAHVGYAAFAGVEGDGFDVAAGEFAGYCVAEFVEGDDEHLGGLLDLLRRSEGRGGWVLVLDESGGGSGGGSGSGLTLNGQRT